MTTNKTPIRRLAVLVSLALVVGLLPGARSAALGIQTLTLAGPSRALAGEAAPFGGRLEAGGVGVPLVAVEVHVDGATAATARTGVDGTYAVSLPLARVGTRQVQAVASAGTPAEVRSPVLEVEVEAPEDPSAATDLAESAEFLYAGAAPVQTGVAPGTIDDARVAVVRGRVLGRDAAPLAGVAVSVAGRPEFGATTTGPDGSFDLAVNGGGALVVTFGRDGFLPVDREVAVPWRDYAVLPDVTLVAFDPAVTTVDLAAPGTKVARGSEVTDDDGTRRATLLFAQGTQATMVAADGTGTPLSSLDVRATEYTVGPTGPSAMPASLPSVSGYTYAVELSVDEAVAAGAAEVRFDRPVPSYVENFLGFPVGTAVPHGSYDRARRAWVAEPDGRVVQVLAEPSGVADLDADGDGDADSAAQLAALGVSLAERQRLAELYDPGQTLWRVAMDHFSPHDLNWPFGLPTGAVAPDQTQAQPADQSGPCKQEGSIIGCENQTLGEVLPVVGTPHVLVYDSSRVPGRRAGWSLRIPVTGETLPPGLLRATVEVSVAGRRFTQSFDPAVPGLSHTFVWDGLDAYGRAVQGAQPATVRVGYVYGAVYYQPAGVVASFGQVGTAPLALNPARQEITVFQEWRQDVGTLFDAGRQALGGWTLSAHHAYDPGAGVLHLGDGTSRPATSVFEGLEAFAGNGAAGPFGEGTFTGDGGPALTAGFSEVEGMAVGPDGSVYVADTGNLVVRRVAPDGTVSVFAGGGTPPDGVGDGGPATAAELGWPTDVAVGADGSVYVADAAGHRVRRVAPDGTITTVAGGGAPADGLGDGGPATAAALDGPRGVAVGPQGLVYIADTGHHRVRRVDPDGAIVTAAGGGAPADGLGDGLPGPQAALSSPRGMAVLPDGGLVVADPGHARVRRLRADGVVVTFAGSGLAGVGGDGGPAIAAQLSDPYGLAYDPDDGSVYIAQRLDNRLRRVGPDGVISRLAGTGARGDAGDRGTPGRALLDRPHDVAVGPDGSVYIADTTNYRIRRVRPSVPGFGAADLLIPSPDGAQVFHFDPNGRHLRTLDARTGALVWTFSYDGAGRLAAVADDFANTTTIERDGDGRPTAIVAPFGQRTVLGVRPDGYLGSVANPAAETTTLGYGEGGLLTSLTSPRNHTWTFSYDELGRLSVDAAPDGKTTTLVRAATDTGVVVTATSSEGRTTTYTTEYLGNGDRRRTLTTPSGAATVQVTSPDGSVTSTSPDGTTATVSFGPDPRWGLQIPLATATTTRTPSGKTLTAATARSVTLANPADPLSLATQVDTLTARSRTTTVAWDGGARTLTTTTPTGRQGVITLNAEAQVVSVAEPGQPVVSYSYDDRGRLIEVTQGSGVEARITTYTFGADGFVATMRDPAERTVSVLRDPAGRVLTTNLPGGGQVGVTYDDSGNLATLTPPGREPHDFGYTSADGVDRYSPPEVNPGVDPSTHFAYNLDRQPTTVSHPDGRATVFAYDSAGRLASTTIGRGITTFGYDPVTSQLSRVEAPGGQVRTFGYDGALLTSLTDSGTVSGTVSYGYDDDWRLASLTLAGSTTAFTYDAEAVLTSAGALSLTRDPSTGRLTGTALGSVTTAHGYNTFGESSADSVAYAGADLYSATYERDRLDRITASTETIGGVTTAYGYRYDLRGRLEEVRADGVVVGSYGYDDNGNRTSATTAGETTTASYDGQDRILTSGAATFTHSADGQLLTKTDGAGTTTYAYDELGNLTAVGLPGGPSIDYVIGPGGQRIAKKVNGAVTQRFRYGIGPQPLAELDGAGNLVSRFIYGSRDHVPDYIVKEGTTYRVVTDQLGSPRLLVNVATGAVAQRLDYDPWGRVITDTNPGFQPFGFAGGLYEPQTGLVRFGARDYNPTVGRFTNRDPLGFGGGYLNLYVYVGNDPVNLIDPSGESSTRPSIGASADLLDVTMTLFEVITTPVDNCPEEAVTTVETKDSVKSPIVIGQGMDRVSFYARSHGYQTILDFPEYQPFNNPFNCRRWVRDMKLEGREVWDIGPDIDSDVGSAAYRMEHEEARNYIRYHWDPQP